MENKETEVVNDMPKKNNTTGMISFIFSLVGILVAGLPCGIAATVTGIIGLTKFDAEKEKGRWMAITGLVIGIIEIIVMTMYIIGQM